MTLKINFKKSQNELNYQKGPENINYTIVKYSEHFTAATTLIPAVLKIDSKCFHIALTRGVSESEYFTGDTGTSIGIHSPGPTIAKTGL